MYVSLDELTDTSNMKMTDDQIRKSLIKLGFVKDITLQSANSTRIKVNVARKKQDLDQNENMLMISSESSMELGTATEITVKVSNQSENLGSSENEVAVTKNDPSSLAA